MPNEASTHFLALFNEIDKFFDKLLEQDKFLPFNEKIKRIVQGKFPITHYIKAHAPMLKHFGELRNEITHGLKIGGQSFVIPSDYALEQLQTCRDAIVKPKTCKEIFTRDVFTCKTSDYLSSVLQTLRDNNYSHTPVYDDEDNFVGMITYKTICDWLADNIKQNKHMNQTRIHELPLKRSSEFVSFISEDTTIHQVDSIFSKKKEHHDHLGTLLITPRGNSKEKLTGIITASDIAIIEQYVIN